LQASPAKFPTADDDHIRSRIRERRRREEGPRPSVLGRYDVRMYLESPEDVEMAKTG